MKPSDRDWGPRHVEIECPLEELVVVAASVTEVLADALASGGASPREGTPGPRRTLADLLSFAALRSQ